MIDQHDSLTEKFVKKGIWLYIFSFIISPIGYIIKIILSEELKVDEIGIIYGVMSLMVLLGSFSDFGMTESLNKFIPEFVTAKRYDKVKSTLLYAILVQMIAGVIIFLIFYFGAKHLSLNYFHDSKSESVIRIFAFFFLGINFFQVINVFFGAIQDTFLQKLTELFRMLFILGFTIYMFLTDIGDMFNYSLSWILGLYFGILVAVFLFYKKYYLIYLKNVKVIYSKELFLTIFKYALVVFLGSQASTLLSQIDMQMIIYLLGSVDAGYYSNYLALVSIPFVIIGPIFGFLFPVFSEMIAKKEQYKIKIIKEIFSKNFLSFSISFSILSLVFSKVISVILFGDKFLMSGVILQYSILFLSFNFLLHINFSILAANGKVKERLNIILTAIIFNTILNYILLRTIGVVGAALATGIGWVLIYILSELKLREYYTGFNYKYLLKNIIVFSLIGFLMYKHLLPVFFVINDRIYELILLVLISIAYFTIYFLINISDFKYFYKKIKRVMIEGGR